MSDPTMPAGLAALLQEPATVTVDRAVLVDLIAIAVAACQEYNDPAARPMARLLRDVQAGRRDTLTAAEWREIGGGE